jgi:uncharacterized protein YciI
MKRYLVLTLRTPRFDPGVIAAHHAYLDGLRARGVLEACGPFTDKSGGAYVIRAGSPEQARDMACADPLHTSGSSQASVREWDVSHVAGPLAA